MTQARPAKPPRSRLAAEPAVKKRAQGRQAAGKPGARRDVPVDARAASGKKAAAKKAEAKTAAPKRPGNRATSPQQSDAQNAGTKSAGAKKSGAPKSADNHANRAADAAHPIAARTASRKGEEPATGRRVQVKKSGVHGKGVYAARPIAKGETIIEYRGEIISWDEALRRHPHDPSDPNHTFYFHLDDGHVIDGKHVGNAAKWINHSCAPNCEAEQDGMRVFIKALRKIAAGEELFYDYGLVIDARITPKLKREYACWCGAKTCRGTMLAGRR
ncbi:MAG: SET domain-containing protein-lysine N-methyltransferase [Burkholderiales bacterium]|nr:SET domain-containing protein-lysine N-methyltransferase [Burkholderiales bacterium]